MRTPLKFNRLLLASCCIALAPLFALGEATNDYTADKVYELDIKEQPLADALRAFANQSGLKVMFFSNVTTGLKAPPIKGRMTRDQALQLLLKSSGLTYQELDATTVTVSAPDVKKASAISTILDADYQLRLAQGDAAIADSGTASGKSKTGSKGDVEEMVVEGSREKPVPFSTSNLDLTRTKDDALPFTTFTARDITLSGATNLQSFLQDRLPQNFSEVVFDEMRLVGNNTRQNQVSMRGWSATETVFLLNGRRMAPQFTGSNGDSSNATPNLQGIPLRSIERIEILSSAGSAIYGANATGGVINIITRTDFKGGQFNVNYATPADTHAPTRGAEATYAIPMSWGTHLRLTASYNELTPLQVQDRADVSVERWRTAVLQRDPARLLSRTAFPAQGATANIRTVATDAAANLFGAGTSNFTTVPDGYTGNGTAASFQPGTYNLQLADTGSTNDPLAKAGYLGAFSSNMVFGLGLDKHFNKDWRWSVDYRYSQNDFEQGNSAFGFVTVPAAAPTNPFARDVYVYVPDPNLMRPELPREMSNVTWDVTSTLHGRVGSWQGYWDIGYSHNNNRNHAASFSEPRGGWNAALMAGTYNPFVDTRVVAAAAPSFYADYLASVFDFVSASGQYLTSLKAAGPLLQLPAGPLQLTSGLEWSSVRRGESYYFTRTVDGLTGAFLPERGYQFARRSGNRFGYDTQSLYTEINAPLIAGRPLINRLELTASGRLDRRLVHGVRDEALNNHVDTMEDQYRGTPFQDATQANVYALAMRYDAVEGMAFRASKSIGFKPPTISQLTPALPPTTTSTVTVSDPRRLNGTSPSTVVLNYTQFVTGGNSALRPETTDSTNIGFVFSPSWVRGLRLSIDYLESVRDDVITSLSGQQAVDLEADFGRVTRGAPDGHPSGVGPITFLDLRQINFRQIASKGVDFTVNQRFDNVFGGSLGLTLAATKNISYKVQTTNTAPPVEQIRSLTSTFSQQIAWNGNTQLTWQGKQWGFGWSARYYDYLLVALGDRLLQGAERVPSKINHDAFVTYSTPKQESKTGWQGMLSGTSISFGVRNIFDREPRFWAANTERGVAPYDSVMGRNVWLQMSKDFE